MQRMVMLLRKPMSKTGKRLVEGVVLGVALVSIMVLTSFTGFLTVGNPYEEQVSSLTTQLADAELSLDEASSDLYTCEQGLSAESAKAADALNSAAQCNSNLETTGNELLNAQVQLTGVQTELDAKASYTTQLEDEKTALEGQNAQLVSEKNVLETIYNSVVSNSAKDLCCVRKVFDNSLTHYYVEDNKIICTSDATKTPFSCG